MDELTTFGAWLRQRRRRLDLTQEALARLAGCATITLKKIEQDERRPSQELAERLAEILAIPLADRSRFLKTARGNLAVDHLGVPIASDAPGPTRRHMNLPVRRERLIGREREVVAVGELLQRDEVSLVTLTGAGGTGKTRLALQVAADLAPAFAYGVCFVDLAPIRDPALVASTIAAALGVKETATQPVVDMLRAYLRTKQLLLLLDNFEQVVVAAPIVAELLQGAPGVKALVTSREPLHLSVEHEFMVRPLALPDPNQVPRADDLSQYAAVALFIRRAQAVKPDFHVTNATAPAVAEICHRLDGLPLAIELAAARSKLLAPDALLSRLHSRLRLLTGGARDLAARHQTLHSTIAWSYDLLPAHEQRLFGRLGVFVGGWSVDAAMAVCHAEDELPVEMLDALQALLNKSLITQLPRSADGEGEPRFTMYETIREYALERLPASRQAEDVHKRHAEYYLARAEEADPKIRSAERLVWLNRLEAEHDNLRAALAWSLSTDGDAHLGLRLAGALGWFWGLRGYSSEGHAWLERALSAGTDQSIIQDLQSTLSARAKALHRAGVLAADIAAAKPVLEQSVALWRDVGDKDGLAYALFSLGANGIRLRSDYATTRALLIESITLFREVGDMYGLVRALNRLAELAWVHGERAEAAAIYDQTIVLSRQLDDKWLIAHSLSKLGRAAYYSGDAMQAISAYEEGLGLWRELGDKARTGGLLVSLGEVARHQGDHERARAYYDESLALWQKLGDTWGIAEVHCCLGYLAYNQGDDTQAAALFASSLAVVGKREDNELNARLLAARLLAGLGAIAQKQRAPQRAARLLVLQPHLGSLSGHTALVMRAPRPSLVPSSPE